MFRALALILLTALPAAAQDCARLAAEAGAAEGIPDGLMPAIALVESGHSDGQGGRSPWPWTLNRGGESHYLDSKEEALAKLDEILAGGTTNVDLGCMQLNWRWHGQSFSGPDEMLDPVANTAYAARFLKELHAQLGSWELATAAYHSTDPDRGTAYLARVAAAQSALAGQDGQAVVLLAAVPVRLQGLLAVGDSPLVAMAAARAALVLRDGDDIALAGPAPAGPQDPAAAPRPRPQGRVTASPPPAPLELAESIPHTVGLDHLPRRLRAHRDEVQSLRDLLATAP